MKKYLSLILLFVLSFSNNSNAQSYKISDFIPETHVIYDSIFGDLNQDGLDDCILTIKETDKRNFVKDNYRGILDRNRRGVIVLFNKNEKYEVAAKNYSCFSSENEDGGIYYAPELNIVIREGKLFVEYSHGRYGYWSYTFRFQNDNFELIGFDSNQSYGPITNKVTSINFLSKKKKIEVNINEDAEGGDEVFNETWSDIHIDKLISLTEIQDFEKLKIYEY